MKNITTIFAIAAFVAVIIFYGCSKQQAPSPGDSPRIYPNSLSSTTGNIAETDIDTGDSCYYWTKSGTVSIGTDTNSTAYHAAVTYSVPIGEKDSTIVAIAIGTGNNSYFYYSNGKMSIGSYTNASSVHALQTYTIPTGESATTIEAISISKNTGKVYTWFKDGYRAIGTPTNLSYYSGLTAFTVTSGKTVAEIVGIGIRGSDDHTIAWYNDGTHKTYSIGTTIQLDYYQGSMNAHF